jgi:hypothetical protein
MIKTRDPQKKRTASPSVKKAEQSPPEVDGLTEVGGSLLVRGVSDDLLKRLERARAERGLRSRNAAVLEILAEGAPK